VLLQDEVCVGAGAAAGCGCRVLLSECCCQSAVCALGLETVRVQCAVRPQVLVPPQQCCCRGQGAAAGCCTVLLSQCSVRSGACAAVLWGVPLQGENDPL